MGQFWTTSPGHLLPPRLSGALGRPGGTVKVPVARWLLIVGLAYAGASFLLYRARVESERAGSGTPMCSSFMPPPSSRSDSMGLPSGTRFVADCPRCRGSVQPSDSPYSPRLLRLGVGHSSRSTFMVRRAWGSRHGVRCDGPRHQAWPLIAIVTRAAHLPAAERAGRET